MDLISSRHGGPKIEPLDPVFVIGFHLEFNDLMASSTSHIVYIAMRKEMNSNARTDLGALTLMSWL